MSLELDSEVAALHPPSHGTNGLSAAGELTACFGQPSFSTRGGVKGHLEAEGPLQGVRAGGGGGWGDTCLCMKKTDG